MAKNDGRKKNKFKPNPIIEAAKGKADGRVHRILGYPSQGAGGKIELYLELSLETCLEIDEQDIVHIVEAEKPTDPAMVFVREESRIVIRRETKASSIAARSLQYCGCEGTPEGGVESPVALRPATTASPGLDCAIRHAGCRINCWLKYPNDALMRGACNNSCDAASRLCRSTGGGGGGIIIL